MTIQGAWKKILEIRKGRDTCVTIQFWQFKSGTIEQRLTLWDGSRNHIVNNVADLVRIAEISVAPEEPADGELPEKKATNE